MSAVVSVVRRTHGEGIDRFFIPEGVEFPHSPFVVFQLTSNSLTERNAFYRTMCKISYVEELRTEVNDGVFIKAVVVSNTSERKMVINTPINYSSLIMKQRKFSSRASLGLSKYLFPKNGTEMTVFSEVGDVKRESKESVSLIYRYIMKLSHKQSKRRIEVLLNGD